MHGCRLADGGGDMAFSPLPRCLSQAPAISGEPVGNVANVATNGVGRDMPSERLPAERLVNSEQKKAGHLPG
jgi:hypothetical protein